MMSSIKQVYTLEQLPEIVLLVASKVSHVRTITFTGSLGAGKTTFIRALLSHWGVYSGVTSPTFTYMQRYTLPDSSHIYHFDLYRVVSLDTLYELGLSEYIGAPDGRVLIEWPDLVKDIIKNPSCHIHLEYDPESSNSRYISISYDEVA